MKRLLVSVGYFLLVFCAIFLNTPMISVVVLPLFLIGAILVTQFYISLVNKKNSFAVLYISLIVLGCILLFSLLGYAAILYDKFQLNLGGKVLSGLSSINWTRTGAILGIYLVALLQVYLGVRTSEKLSEKRLISFLLPALFMLPATIVLMQFAILVGLI